MDSSTGGFEASGAAVAALELLENQITELSAHIHAATFRLLALIAEFDRREGWGGAPVRTG